MMNHKRVTFKCNRCKDNFELKDEASINSMIRIFSSNGRICGFCGIHDLIDDGYAPESRRPKYGRRQNDGK